MRQGNTAARRVWRLWEEVDLKVTCWLHGRMARGGHGLTEVSFGPAMLYLFMACGQATPETALRPFWGWPAHSAGPPIVLAACGCLLPPWTSHAVHLWLVVNTKMLWPVVRPLWRDRTTVGRQRGVARWRTGRPRHAPHATTKGRDCCPPPTDGATTTTKETGRLSAAETLETKC
jgi:hypothetical protein